jgi:phage shock protein A
MQKSYDSITEQVNKLRAQVTGLKAKLDEARSRQSVLIARSKMAEATQGVTTAISATSTDSAFAKLDALERRITEQEAVAEAYVDMNSEEVSVEREFEVMAHNAAVDSELARLKAELGI